MTSVFNANPSTTGSSSIDLSSGGKNEPFESAPNTALPNQGLLFHTKDAGTWYGTPQTMMQATFGRPDRFLDNPVPPSHHEPSCKVNSSHGGDSIQFEAISDIEGTLLSPNDNILHLRQPSINPSRCVPNDTLPPTDIHDLIQGLHMNVLSHHDLTAHPSFARAKMGKGEIQEHELYEQK